MYDAEMVGNILNWVASMKPNIEKLSNSNKIKMLFDKWTIIQNQTVAGAEECRNKLHNEALKIVHEIRDFDLMHYIAKNSFYGSWSIL
jgi:hypothetical protein